VLEQEKTKFRRAFLRGSLTPAEIEEFQSLLDQAKKTGVDPTDKERDKIEGCLSFLEQEKINLWKAAEETLKKSAAESKEAAEAEELYFKKPETPGQPELEIYGHKLFSRPPDTLAPIKALPVSSNYIVGPGDEIRVLMWGRLDAEYSLEVDNEGVINFPKIGTLVVAGMTFEEVKKLIRQKAEAITGVYVNVSMGRLRTMQVFLLGEVKAPGVYTISALATVANALLYSGGPTRLGSLRNVQLKRQGRVVSVIDLYDFLMKGDTADDIRLMPGDVIFVPQTGPMVSVSGNVNRPAIYELKDDMRLETVLELSGGLTPRAFNQRLQIERAFKNQFQVVLDIPYEELNPKKAPALLDGDVVTVFSILPLPRNAIHLYGNVRRPGRYAFKPGLRVLDILADIDELEKDTHYDYALVKRYHLKDMKSQLIPFDLGRLLLSKDPSQNILLAPLDEIYVFNKQMFKDRESAVVQGQVRKPGRYFIDQMKIRDLIQKAGDLTEDAYPSRAELIRVDKERNLHTVYFDVAAAMAGDPAHNLSLQDEDRMVIHSIWEKKWKTSVTIEGEVKQPGEYVLTSGMRLNDLFFKAGRFTRDAYQAFGHLHRTDWQTRDISIHTFDVAKAAGGDPADNLLLQDLDQVVIHSIWEYKEKYSVSIHGPVNRPGKYPYAGNMTIKELILVAGNVKDGAFLDQAELVRSDIMDGKRVETSVINFDVRKALENQPAHNYKLQPLDTITLKEIPRWTERQNTVTVGGEVYFPGSYTIREGERLSDLIERAGGFTEKAYLRGALFTRASIQKMQQQRLDELVESLEKEAATQASTGIQTALSAEDMAAQAQYVAARQGLIAKLKRSKASGRVVVSVRPQNVLKGHASDIFLEDGDSLLVPATPNTVNVLGSVYNPTAFVYDTGKRELKYYLAQTGGPTRNAEEKSMYLVRADGTVVSRQQSSWLGMQWDSDGSRWGFGKDFEDTPLYPGDTVLVPEKIVRPSYMRDFKDITQILYQIATTAGVTIALF
ncbi:MAG: SLBB domain-containing protein, partial [Desulfobacterales bacterium]|nr:SLBB domain-containing protein [Desulfobacterales bacterium]